MKTCGQMKIRLGKKLQKKLNKLTMHFIMIREVSVTCLKKDDHEGL